jgi:outer membrane protein assembly factor BamB
MSWYQKNRNAVSIGVLILVAGAAGYIWYDRYYLPPLPAPSKPMAVTVGRAATTDWPQWRGPNRDGVSIETGLLKEWPTGGPKLLWTFEHGGVGYSAPAVVGGKVFLPGAKGKVEYLFAIDAATGKDLGDAVIGHLFQSGDDHGSGPRGTPAVDGERVYAMGGKGDLACINAAKGDVVWRHNIYRDFDGTEPHWGCTESVLIDGDRLICSPGGPKGTVMALNKLTGDPVWRCGEFKDPCSYSSAVSSDFGGVRHYIQMSPAGIGGVAAADGRLLWYAPRQGPVAAIPTPVVRNEFVYITSGYNAGCNLLKLSASGKDIKAEEVYSNQVMKNHHGGVVLIGDHIYGYSDGAGWICQEVSTGKMVWNEKKKLGKGCLTAADGRLYCYSEDEGIVCLVEATPEGWKEHGRFTIPRQTATKRGEGKIWTHPVIAEGKLYLRDQELLFCYDIKGP